MTQIIEATKCTHCGCTRSDDGRHPCPGCGKRQRNTAAPIKPAQRIEGEDLVVIASDPAELAQAQVQMIARLDEKILDAEKELVSARGGVDELPKLEEGESAAAKSIIANAHARLESSSKRLVEIAQRRIVYLQKVRAALAAGFVMMPNFPGHVIAIRTAKRRPPVQSDYDAHARALAPVAQPDAALAPGEGNYVKPVPEHTRSPNGTDRTSIIVEGWDDEIALPVEFLKPNVVQRTVAALDLKIFDEVILVRDGESRDSFAGQSNPPRGKDPMVVGRVVLRKPGDSYRQGRRVLSFLIAWFMDTSLI